MAREELAAVISDLGLVVEVEFVPWSKSHSYDAAIAKNVSKKNLNWRVTLRREYPRTGPDPIDFCPRDILTTDYSAGIAHTPYYKKHKEGTLRWSLYNEPMYEYEVEHGKEARELETIGVLNGGALILPDPIDVIWSLAQDAGVLNAGSFEEWASDLGYDTDSRKAEATYRACLDIALKLRNGIGEDGLQRLQEAGEDY